MTMEMVLVFAMFTITIGVVAIVAMYFFMRFPAETPPDRVSIASKSKASPDPPLQGRDLSSCPDTANSESAQDFGERGKGEPDDAQNCSLSSRSNVIIFDVPSGTRWGDISLYHVDGHNLSVRLPGQKAVMVNFMQLDMNSKQNQLPTAKWKILVALCEGHGSCGWRKIGSASFEAFKTQVCGLRSQLQEIFNLPDDPFSECSKQSGLRAKFQAFPDAPGRSGVPFLPDVPVSNASDPDPA